VRAITSSSRAALPARSPMPLTVTSTCRAPASIAAIEFATASPRSLWQCTDSTALCMLGTPAMIPRMNLANSCGTA
jgi:hypothetical protein